MAKESRELLRNELWRNLARIVGKKRYMGYLPIRPTSKVDSRRCMHDEQSKNRRTKTNHTRTSPTQRSTFPLLALFILLLLLDKELIALQVQLAAENAQTDYVSHIDPPA